MTEIRSLSKSDKTHLALLASTYVFPGKRLSVTGDGRVTTRGEGFLWLKNKQSSDFLSVILLSIGEIIHSKGEIEHVRALCAEGIHIMNMSNDRSEVITRAYRAHLATDSLDFNPSDLPKGIDVEIEMRSRPGELNTVRLGQEENLSNEQIARFLNQTEYIVFK